MECGNKPSLECIIFFIFFILKKNFFSKVERIEFGSKKLPWIFVFSKFQKNIFFQNKKNYTL